MTTQQSNKKGPWSAWEFLAAGFLMGILMAIVTPFWIISIYWGNNPVDPIWGVFIGFLVPMFIGVVGFLLRIEPRRFPTRW